MSFVRSSVDGLNGAGKTCTIAQFAVGLAKEYGDGADVHVFDSSDRWAPWKKLIFDVEKIRLHIHYGESIAVLQKAMDAALKGPCSVFVGDDLTVPWMEGVESFSFENGNLTFERRAQLLREWRQFVRGFRHGPFHSLACGRLGYVWENVEDQDGNEKLHQGDSKFNAGGGENFGYDADLELEMRRRKRRLLGLIRGRTTMEYVCDVVKDARGILNNQQFVFQDWTNGYKPGMYRNVLDYFRPHIDFVRSLDTTRFDSESSRNLVVSGQTAWGRDQSQRKGLLEEFSANLDMAFPSGEGKSKLSKMFRDLTLEFLNGFISWSRMEEECSTPNLERNLLILKAVRKRVESGEIPTEQESLRTLLNLATDDVLHPGKHVTLLEAMGHASIAQVGRGKHKPQPAVGIMDRVARDEVATGD